MSSSSTKAPKVHSANQSIRTKAKQEVDSTRRTVFRPVLDNPLNVTWPPLGAAVRSDLFAALLAFLTAPTTTDELPIAEWRLQEHARRRGRVHGAGVGAEDVAGNGNAPGSNKKRKRDKQDAGHASQKGKGPDSSEAGLEAMDITPEARVPVVLDSTNSHSIQSRSNKEYIIPNFVDSTRKEKSTLAPLARPQVLNHLSVGINEVTRALETRIRWGRWELGDENAAPGAGPSRPAIPPVTIWPTPLEASKKSHVQKARKMETTVPPLNLSHPTSRKTLERPSYQFLSRSVPKHDSKIPPYLLAPTETNPSFRAITNSTSQPAESRKTKDQRTAEISARDELRKRILHDVIIHDDPQGFRSSLQRGKRIEVVQSDLNFVVLPNLPAEEQDEILNPTKKKEKAPVEESEVPWTVPTVPLLDLIFVCRPDINPPSLVAHLPTMTAAANGVREALEQVRPGTSSGVEKQGVGVDTEMVGEEEEESGVAGLRNPVYLIPLDVGAERHLAEALALRRVATIGLSVSIPSSDRSMKSGLISIHSEQQSLAPGIDPLLSLIEKHCTPLTAPWLIPHLTSPHPICSIDMNHQAPSVLIPTHIKHLKSSAPKDMKKAALEKKEVRVKKRERRMCGQKGVYVVREGEGEGEGEMEM